MCFDLRDSSVQEAASCMWVAYAASKLSCFIPVFVAAEKMPAPYTVGEFAEYDLSSAWWAYEEVGELCYRNYDAIAKKVVIPAFRELEKKFMKEHNGLEAALSNLPSEERQKAVKQMSHRCADEAYKKALWLEKYIKGNYLCNTILITN